VSDPGCAESFDVYYTYYQMVPYVQRVEPGVGGYWEYGVYADIQHWEAWVFWHDGSRTLWASGDNIEKVYSQFEYWASTAPPPPPPPSNDEIRRDSDQRIATASGEAPRTVLYAPGVKNEIDRDLQTNWAGYTLADKPSGVLDVAYSGGDVYPTHPLVHEAKEILQALLGFPYVIDDEYGPLTAGYIRQFQEMTGLTKVPGIQAGVLDETTFQKLKESQACYYNPDGCVAFSVSQDNRSAVLAFRAGERKTWDADAEKLRNLDDFLKSQFAACLEDERQHGSPIAPGCYMLFGDRFDKHKPNPTMFALAYLDSLQSTVAAIDAWEYAQQQGLFRSQEGQQLGKPADPPADPGVAAGTGGAGGPGGTGGNDYLGQPTSNGQSPQPATQGINFTETTTKRMQNPGRAVPVQILQQAIQHGIPQPDPVGAHAFCPQPAQLS